MPAIGVAATCRDRHTWGTPGKRVGSKEPPGASSMTRAGWTGRLPGGLVSAWYSPGAVSSSPKDKTQAGGGVGSDRVRRRRLADSHLTSPMAIQRWTTSLLVYRQSYDGSKRISPKWT